MVISNHSMFQINAPLTHCVGIDKARAEEWQDNANERR